VEHQEPRDGHVAGCFAQIVETVGPFIVLVQNGKRFATSLFLSQLRSGLTNFFFRCTGACPGDPCGTTQDGLATTVFPAGNAGASGSLQCTPGPNWITSIVLLEKVDNYIRDAYMGRAYERVRQLIDIYLPAIQRAQPSANSPLSIFEARFQLYLQLLQEHQDYWNLPIGWVPRLSFEANALLFSYEVEFNIRTIYQVEQNASFHLKNYFPFLVV